MSRRGGTRLSGGQYRGRRVAVPPGIRPTGGLVKQALFSIWADRVQGSRFLDLFAGSGAVGLEAWSRGADSIDWVEGEARVARATRHTVEKLAGLGSRVALAWLPDQISRGPQGPFDLIFADPPYEFEGYAELVAAISKLLAAKGSLAVEHSLRVPLPDSIGDLRALDRRKYGESGLTIYGSG